MSTLDCPDCRRMTSGDCGKHGPFTSGWTTDATLPDTIDLLRNILAALHRIAGDVETLRLRGRR